MLPTLITLLKGAMTVAPAVEAAVRTRRARDVETAYRDLEVECEVLQQTWQAHQLQVRERNQLIGFSQITLALLVVGFTVALVGDLPALAAANAAVGAGLVVFFNRLDASYRARVHATERAFREQDERLVAAGEPSRMSLIASAGGLSLEALLLALEAVAFWAFVAAFLYAVIDAT
jgi:hypothetical protein